MSTEWLAIQSFQHDQDVLIAINTLSIHIKLGLAGVFDEQRYNAANDARCILSLFLKELDVLVQQSSQTEAEPLLGNNHRVRELVKSFTDAKRDRNRFESVLFRDTISCTQELLYSSDPNEQKSLIKCLEELRVIIEEHIYADTERILGDT